MLPPFSLLRFQARVSTGLKYCFATFARGQAKAKASELLQSGSGQPVRVRFAPSPTGSLHVGGARTALFNWLFARKMKGKFIVRVEDTDEARSTKESEESILNDLKWLGLHWDEGPDINSDSNGNIYNSDNVDNGDKNVSSGNILGIKTSHIMKPNAKNCPSAGDALCFTRTALASSKYVGPYRQSERKSIYIDIAERLIKEGKAYRCFCTEEELEAKRLQMEKAGVIEPKYDGTWREADTAKVQLHLDRGDPYTVRFKLPEGNKIVSFVDMVRETVSWDAKAVLGDFIILRSSGVPVYNFCVAVDDALMEITHVIRAEEHLSNTLRQLLILEALGRPPPTYAHCSLILGTDRSKLSKRHGATSVSQFRRLGLLPDAMLNYLTNLGFNDGTTKEIYEPNELIDSFDLTRIVKGAAIFDNEKLKWINGQHIRRQDLVTLRPLVAQVLREPDTISVGNPAILSKAFVDADNLNETRRKFLDVVTDICRRDMELISDSHRLISNVLQFSFIDVIGSDETAREIASSVSFKTIVSAILRDYYSSKNFPGAGVDRGSSSEVPPFGIDPEAWKAYVKALTLELGIKGKDFYRPFRLALTGRLQGPEIYDQLNLISYIRISEFMSDSNNDKSNSNSDNNSENDFALLNPGYKLNCSLENRMKILKEWNESNKSS